MVALAAPSSSGVSGGTPQRAGSAARRSRQPEPAIEVFERYVKVKPTAYAAWRTFMAMAAGRSAGAAQRIPVSPLPFMLVPAVSSIFCARSPPRTSPSAVTSTRSACQERALSAVSAGSTWVAGGDVPVRQPKLQQANRLDQAAGLFRQVLRNRHGHTLTGRALSKSSTP